MVFKRLFLPALFFFISSSSAQQATEKYLGTQSNTYEEAIQFYADLDRNHKNASMLSYGYTDSGRQLSLFVIAGDSDMNPASIKAKNKAVLLINNAIHPGATEVCNSIDDDCDGCTDEGFDQDNDGYTVCEGDCNDALAAIHPGATEICNGIDDDCEG